MSATKSESEEVVSAGEQENDAKDTAAKKKRRKKKNKGKKIFKIEFNATFELLFVDKIIKFLRNSRPRVIVDVSWRIMSKICDDSWSSDTAGIQNRMKSLPKSYLRLLYVLSLIFQAKQQIKRTKCL